MQANGAEMLRIACCLATEQGIRLCSPIHDALLVEAPESDIEEIVRATESVMCRASKIVLSGFPLRTDAKIIRYPERYSDERGKEMWEKVMGLLNDLEMRI
jgi:DNA polymerase-1